MIQNPIITGNESPLLGKFNVTALSNVINIPVSKLCSNVIVFPLDVVASTADFSTSSVLTVAACSPLLIDSGTYYFHGCQMSKGYYDVDTDTQDDGAVSLDKTIQASTWRPITFTSDNIKIVRDKKFAKGTYGYVAW